MEQYQLRDFQAISRHIDLVAVACGLLLVAPHDETLLHRIQRQLKFDLEERVKAECTRLSFGLTLQRYWLASEWLAKMGGVRPSPEKCLRNCLLTPLFIPPLAAAKVESVDPEFGS